MNRVFAGSVAGTVVCELLLAGCKSSTRSLDLGKATFEIGSPVQILPAGSIPLAASQDGSLIAVLVSTKGKEARLEVRDTGMMKVRYAFDWANGEGLSPLMFSPDKRSLVGFDRRGIGRLDLASGKMTTIAVDREGSGGIGLFPLPRNYDHTIIGVQGWFVTASGKLIKIAKPGKRFGYDPYGNAWALSGKGWARVDRNGNVTLHRARPGYLVKDQATERGPMRLVQESIERERRGGEANIDVIWLDRTGTAVGPKSAVAFVGTDVLTYGFMPGRDQIYVLSSGGNYLIPFSIKPKPAVPPIRTSEQKGKY